MKQAKIYDYAGVLVDISGWYSFFKQAHPDLYQRYVIEGETNMKLKRQIRPEVLKLYEQAVEEGKFPMPTFPDVPDRMSADKRDGYHSVIFTSSPKAPLEAQLKDNGLTSLVSQVIILDDVREFCNQPDLMKEDPAVFQYLTQLLLTDGLQPETYIDDALKRIQSAVQANTHMIEQGMHGISRLYHLDRKTTNPIARQEGYTTINCLPLVD